MDLVILVGIIIVVVFVKKDVKFVAYLIGILEVFCRIIHYLGDNIPFVDINGFVNRYIPTSLFSIASKYTSGPIYDFVSWVLVVLFIMFLFYLIQYLVKSK